MEASASNLFGAEVNGNVGDRGNALGEQLAELWLRIQASADRGAALRERIELLCGDAHACKPELHLLGIAGEFLAEGKGSRILRMGAADLDDFRELLRLVLKRLLQMRQRGLQCVHDLGCGGDVHRGREHIVRRLAHVDVIVRMHRRLLAALAAQQLVGAVRDHLVEVHVALGAGAGLPDDQREMFVELAVDHLLGSVRNHASALAVEDAERLVDVGRRTLDQPERADERQRHALLADAEILQRALGLRAPIFVRRDIDRSERIGLGAGLRHDPSFIG